MSMFYCSVCDMLRDSDDGCIAAPNGQELICVECESELEDEKEEEL